MASDRVDPVVEEVKEEGTRGSTLEVELEDVWSDPLFESQLSKIQFPVVKSSVGPKSLSPPKKRVFRCGNVSGSDSSPPSSGEIKTDSAASVGASKLKITHGDFLARVSEVVDRTIAQQQQQQQQSVKEESMLDASSILHANRAVLEEKKAVVVAAAAPPKRKQPSKKKKGPEDKEVVFSGKFITNKKMKGMLPVSELEKLEQQKAKAEAEEESKKPKTPRKKSKKAEVPSPVVPREDLIENLQSVCQLLNDSFPLHLQQFEQCFASPELKSVSLIVFNGDGSILGSSARPRQRGKPEDPVLTAPRAIVVQANGPRGSPKFFFCLESLGCDDTGRRAMHMLLDHSARKIVFGYKEFLVLALKFLNIVMLPNIFSAGRVFDMQIAGWLLDPDRKYSKLEFDLLLKIYCNVVVEKPLLDDGIFVKHDQILQSLANFHLLMSALEPKLVELDLVSALEQREAPLAALLAEMEATGMLALLQIPNEFHSCLQEWRSTSRYRSTIARR